MSNLKPYQQPIVKSTTVFKEDIFKGKVLFCTGGGSGICRGMVESMMRHGCDAVILGRQKDRLTQAAKELSEATRQKCIPIQVDVRQPKTLHEAVQATLKVFGKIDFVICGAAGNFLAPISALSENAFRTVIEIDTLGTFNTVKATLPYIRATRGSYLHVSMTIHYKGTPYQSHSSAAKAAVDAFSAALAVEEGPHGVRSNVIAPGPIADTTGMDKLGTKDVDPKEYDHCPGGRIGQIQDIANATVFLFSDAAAFVTGEILVVDGGFEHVRRHMVPYPKGVLDPESVKDIIKGKL